MFRVAAPRSYVLRLFESLSTRQAQRDKPPAATVMRRKNGSLARCGHSMMIRKRCARVSSAKTAPVVMTYAFTESSSGETGLKHPKLIRRQGFFYWHYLIRNRTILPAYLFPAL